VDWGNSRVLGRKEIKTFKLKSMEELVLGDIRLKILYRKEKVQFH
jgi:hypothetical protein